MKDGAIEIIGWLGMILIVLAYALVSFLIIKPDEILYPVLSGLGAIGVMLNAIKKKDRPSVGLQIVWCVITIIALARIISG